MSLSEKQQKNNRRRLGEYILSEGRLDAAKARIIHEKIPFDYPQEIARQEVANLIENGYHLLNVSEAGKPVGFIIYTIVEKEFLIWAGYVDGQADPISTLQAKLDAIALEKGCTTMRLHTMRAPLVEKLMGQDWYTSEIVMRRDIPNV